MSSTLNNVFTSVGDDQLDAWDAGFKAKLEYFNEHGIERPWEAQGMNASSMLSSYSFSVVGLCNRADSVTDSGQDFLTFGDRAHKNTPDHNALTPAMARVENEAGGPYPGSHYCNSQVPESRVDDEVFWYQHHHPAGQENLAPYAGHIVDFGIGAQDLRYIPAYQLAQSPQNHVDDQDFHHQGQHHVDQSDPALNTGQFVDDDEIQFLGNNYDCPDPTDPHVAGPSAPTGNHALGAQQGSSAQHVGNVASQNNGDGAAQMSTQDAEPLTDNQRGRRNPKGRTTKKVDDIRRRRVRPGPAGGLTLELFNPVTETWGAFSSNTPCQD